jgi:hypothetical protein
MNYISIGVDPGSSSGAIAIIRDGNLVIHGMNRKTEQQIERVFYETLLDKGFQTNMFGVIEKVSAMKGQGVSSTFKFGMNYGFLRACLVANRIPFRDFIPRVWQKEFSMTKKKNESGPQWKERLLNVAQNLYPDTEIPLYAGDAVLLSHIARTILTTN